MSTMESFPPETASTIPFDVERCRKREVLSFVESGFVIEQTASKQGK